MSKPYKPENIHLTHALESIVRGTYHFDRGEYDHAQRHADVALSHIGSFEEELKAKNLHQTPPHSEALDHIKRFHNTLTQCLDLARRVRKAEVPGSKYAPKMPPKLKRPAIKPAAPAGPIPTQINRAPGMDPRYQYKPFHELKQEDKQRAHYAFNGKDMENYHYPTQQGNFVHGTRALRPANQEGAQPPKGDSNSYMKPEHKVNADVKIDHPENKELHGQRGFIRMPNPNMPGKVRVQLGTQVAYLNPDQVKLAKAEEVVSTMDTLAEKARACLEDIKETLNKAVS